MNRLKQMVVGLHNLHTKRTRQMRKEYWKHFETSLRSDGISYIKLKDNRPDDLAELIKEVHFEHFDKCLPNDWIYRTILEAFEELAENELDSITIESDIYYGQLYKWFGEPFAHELCQEAQEEGLCEGKGIYEIIGTAQWLAKDRIYHAVNDFIQGSLIEEGPDA